MSTEITEQNTSAAPSSSFGKLHFRSGHKLLLSAILAAATFPSTDSNLRGQTNKVDFEIPAGGKFNFTVRFEPTEMGVFSDFVTFTFQDSTNVVKVPIVGRAFPLLDSCFQANRGLIEPPFISTPTGISQCQRTEDMAQSGRATFGFNITNDGNYVILAKVNCGNPIDNSIFINIDGDPVGPSMIWDIPITMGYSLVSWRGSDGAATNQSPPKTFALTRGQHYLDIRGLAANVELGEIRIVPGTNAPLPVVPPSGLKIRETANNHPQGKVMLGTVSSMPDTLFVGNQAR